MQWTDHAFILSARRHGDGSAIVTVLTRDHGRHAGLMRGAATRHRAVLMPGTRVAATWRGRLPTHLGTLVCEPVTAVPAGLFTDPDRLAGLVAACAVAESGVPEREPQADVFEALADMVAALVGQPEWLPEYVRWEVRLLAELGFGLDLDRCAATGSVAELVYVSPRTGRAVSRAAGAAYHDRMLRLPPFLIRRDAAGSRSDVVDGLILTGHFLARHVYAALGRDLPPARRRLVERLRSQAGN